MITVRVKGHNLRKFHESIKRMKIRHHPFRQYYDTYEITLRCKHDRLNFLILSNLIDSFE